MQGSKFSDTCVISRNMGHKDEFGNPVDDIIYEGACLYQESGQVLSYSIITRNPALYLPSNDVLVQINDAVTITTETGRVIKTLVQVARDVRLKFKARINMTTIELKQATSK